MTRLVCLPDGEKKYDDMLNRFDRIPACDKQTDRHLATVQSALCMASRSRNQLLP